MFSLHQSMPTDSPVVGYTARDTVWNLVHRAALGSWSHYFWTQALLAALGSPANRWDFSTPHPWPHKFYSTSVTNELVLVRQDYPRASQPWAILKFRPPSSLDYKARHGPQTNAGLIRGCFHRCRYTPLLMKPFNLSEKHKFSWVLTNVPMPICNRHSWIVSTAKNYLK